MFTKTDIEKYFVSEKQAGLFFLIIGIIAVATAIVYLIFIKTSFYKGASIPLIIIGLLFAIAGYTIFKKSDEDRMRNVYAYDMNPSELKEKELPRMRKVMKDFIIYKYTQLFLLLLGAGLYIYFIRDLKNDFWRGFGITLAIMSLIAFTADYFAAKRGKAYTNGIESFVSKS